MHRLKRHGLLSALLILALAFTGELTFAQASGVIAYGSAVTGTLSAEAPIAIYTFNANPGDLITAQVIAISPGLQPTLSLLSPTQQQLATGADDFYSPGPGISRVSYRLVQTGTHFLTVGSVDGTGGEFVLRLDADGPVVATGLGPGTSTEANIPLGAPSQTYSFNADPAAPTTITIGTTDPDFAFTVEIRDADGQLVALLASGVLQSLSLTLAPGEGSYEVTVSALDPTMEGTVTFLVDAAPEDVVEVPPAGESVPSVTPTLSSSPSDPVPSSDVCQVTSGGNHSVNLRGGPGTAYAVVGSLEVGVYLDVLGYYSAPDGVWYKVDYGPEAWVRNDVAAATGPCDTLPQAEAPAILVTSTYTPTSAAGPTYTPSPTSASGDSTLTYTPSPSGEGETQYTSTYTPTPTYTPTEAPSEAQTAPEDARFNTPLNVPLDNTASVLDFVSYPGGDQEDRVRFDITGMNPNAALSGGRARLVITASCFGDGTEHIQFFTGGQTYACGDTIVDREVTYDSRTGSVVITAVGGEGTYVQWVLTGTATRTN